MAKPDREKRICIMRRDGNRLAPVTAWNAEIVAEFAYAKDDIRAKGGA